MPQSNTYAVLNRDLLLAANAAPFAVRHITGEARVLIDPAHRKVVDYNGQRGMATWIACRQTGTITDAVTFIAAQRGRWSTFTWDDLLDIVNLAATGKVRIFVLQDPAPIHFSLYGQDRLLVQQPHPHPDEKKLVWYIQSEQMVQALSDLAARLFDTAMPIPSSSFASLRSWLYSDRIAPLLSGPEMSAEMRAALTESDVQTLLDLHVFETDFSGNLVPRGPTLQQLARESNALLQAPDSETDTVSSSGISAQ